MIGLLVTQTHEVSAKAVAGTQSIYYSLDMNVMLHGRRPGDDPLLAKICKERAGVNRVAGIDGPLARG